MDDKYHYFKDIDETFQFGKHKGMHLWQVITQDPTYLYWCANNIPDLGLSVTTIQQIRSIFPDYILPYNFKNHIREINEEWEDEYDPWYDYEQERYDYDEPEHYGRYAGSWAQEVEGYSDEDIDTIFDGDPLAYWNID